MNVERVKQEMLDKYPGANIKENVNNENRTTELVGEIDRELVGSTRDVAIVVADQSATHYHRYTTETYEIIKGSLRVFLNGVPHDLLENDRITVMPGVRHSVEGQETWFYCYSVPDWTPEDYHPV